MGFNVKLKIDSEIKTLTITDEGIIETADTMKLRLNSAPRMLDAFKILMSIMNYEGIKSIELEKQ